MTAPGAGAAGGTGRLILAIVAVAVLLLLGTLGAVSRAALDAFEGEVRPEIERQAQVIGEAAAQPLQRALDLGVPFAELVAVEPFLAQIAAVRAGVEYLAVVDANGTVRYRAGPRAALATPLPRDLAGGGAAVVLRALPQAFDAALPLRQDGVRVGWLHVGVGRAAIDTVSVDTRWDILIVLLVALLTTIELLRFVVERLVAAPLHLAGAMMRRLAAGDWTARAEEGAGDEAGRLIRRANALIRRMNDRWQRLDWLAGEVGAASAEVAAQARAAVAALGARLRFHGATPGLERLPVGAATARLPLFLFVFAEQLSTSFIPLHAQALSGAAGTPMALALPIAAFVAAVALATPYGGRLVAARGPRAAILLGAVPALLGHAGAAFAGDVWLFAAWRAVSGVGYAIVTIGCQWHMAQAAPTGRLARSLGGFVGGVMTGAVCGTAIGAVIADRIGFGATFLVSALLVLVVQAVVWTTMAGGAAGSGPRATVWREAATAFRLPVFAALVLFAAIPAKIVLAGFVFYIAPLELKALGLSQPAVGRMVMLYGMTMLPAIALGAWLADRWRCEAPLIWIAGLANGAGLLLPLVLGAETALAAAIVATGIAQGLASAPMLALVPAAARAIGLAAPSLLGFLRLGERIGSVAGPFAAAWLLASGGAAQAMVVLGLVSGGAALIYALATLLPGTRRVEAP